MSSRYDRGSMRPTSSSAIDARVSLIQKTYAHLFGAIVAFAALTALLVNLPFTGALVSMVLGQPMAWLALLVGFSLVGMVADRWARSDAGPAVQYLGLGLYVVLESVLFTPLLYVAANFSDPLVIPAAGILTMTVFAGLTVAVFVTKRDFSFLRTAIIAGSFLALGVIVVALLFGLSLGVWFSVAMVGLASISVLYYTSRVLRDYAPGQHVAASLALFSAIALMFWYVLRLLMFSSSSD